jgi:hypothetical protein
MAILERVKTGTRLTAITGILGPGAGKPHGFNPNYKLVT